MDKRMARRIARALQAVDARAADDILAIADYATSNDQREDLISYELSNYRLDGRYAAITVILGFLYPYRAL